MITQLSMMQTQKKWTRITKWKQQQTHWQQPKQRGYDERAILLLWDKSWAKAVCVPFCYK